MTSVPIADERIGQVPIDGDEPEIYSSVKSTAPFSFVLGLPYDKESPPPTYLPIDFLQSPKPVLMEEILSGFNLTNENSLECTNQDSIERQKGIVYDLLKSAVINIASGLGMARIRLPIRIFEPRSYVERLVDRFSFAPVFLGQPGTTLQNFLNVVSFAAGSMYMAASHDKPFNPLIGETFQGYFPDGSEMYIEHVSHHPPIDNFLLVGGSYRVCGSYELTGILKANKLIGGFQGKTYVKIQDQEIEFTQGNFIVSGLIFGSRKVNWEGVFEFVDKHNDLKAILRVGKKKKSFFRSKYNSGEFSGKVTAGGKVLGKFAGTWLTQLVFKTSRENTVIWDMRTHLPMRHIPASSPLPSDWRYREDLIWLTRGNRLFAENWKYNLELKQRDEYLLRGGT